MQWMRFSHAGAEGFGLVDGDAVQVHTGDMFDAPRATGTRLPLADCRWLPPCRPRQILGLWNNFRAAADKNGWAAPPEPLYFAKAVGSLNAHGEPIPAPGPDVGRVLYEGELAVVIGRRAHRVPREDAASHIFGYTLANDVTALEVLQRDASFAQWTRAKGMPGFCPLGPVIATGFEPAGAVLRTLVGGRERQNYALDDMFFGPAELVHRISQDLVLEPGDVILCGTSLGAMPMKPGTEVQVAVDGIGTLANLYG